MRGAVSDDGEFSIEGGSPREHGSPLMSPHLSPSTQQQVAESSSVPALALAPTSNGVVSPDTSKKSRRSATKKKVTDLLRTSVNVVELDVGGARFKTSISTLTSTESMLSAMFSGRFELHRQADGSVFIDRDGRLFVHVLNWLRDRSLPAASSLSRDERAALRTEANFYHLPELVTALDECDAAADATVSPDLTRMEFWRFYSSNPHARLFRGLCLRGLNLSHFDLQRCDFTGSDLSYCDLSHCNLQQAILARCNMRGATLKFADLRRADLERSDLREASLHAAQLQEANLTHVDFAGCVLSEVNLKNANLTATNLAAAKFKRLSIETRPQGADA